MLTNVLIGLKSLLNPKNSEFWSAVAAVLGQVAVATGLVTQEQWNNWWPAILVYVGARFSSKVAKG